jgi:hypothetical protein
MALDKPELSEETGTHDLRTSPFKLVTFWAVMDGKSPVSISESPRMAGE